MHSPPSLKRTDLNDSCTAHQQPAKKTGRMEQARQLTCRKAWSSCSSWAMKQPQCQIINEPGAAGELR